MNAIIPTGFHWSWPPRYKAVLIVLYFSIKYSSFRPFATALPAIIFPRADTNATDAATDDRSGTFQVLADGTQDLAALVGVFATDSVERYAVDYTHGYLSVAVSTCSLLGVLGYVRALFKLAIGPKACENSSFPTAPIRPIFGVAESDRLSMEELFIVQYVRRTKHDWGFKYERIKAVYHTSESFLLARYLPHDEVASATPHCFDSTTYFINNHRDRERLGLPYRATRPKDDMAIMLPVWLATSACSAATSFPVLLVKGTGGFQWTRLMASYGLFASLVLSHGVWSHVFLSEQIPSDYDSSEDWLAILRPASKHRIQLAFCNLRPVYGHLLMALRCISFLCIAGICLGYICQYIVLRQSSTSESVAWLAIHSGLAIFRLLVWVVDPDFDSFMDAHTTQTDIAMVFLQSKTKDHYRRHKKHVAHMRSSSRRPRQWAFNLFSGEWEHSTPQTTPEKTEVGREIQADYIALLFYSIQPFQHTYTRHSSNVTWGFQVSKELASIDFDTEFGRLRELVENLQDASLFQALLASPPFGLLHIYTRIEQLTAQTDNVHLDVGISVLARFIAYQKDDRSLAAEPIQQYSMTMCSVGGVERLIPVARIVLPESDRIQIRLGSDFTREHSFYEVLIKFRHLPGKALHLGSAGTPFPPGLFNASVPTTTEADALSGFEERRQAFLRLLPSSAEASKPPTTTVPAVASGRKLHIHSGLEPTGYRHLGS
ncbi:hypothetical protein BJ508DRAFT_417514 [Ascobolus immersus RN42]|uniref:Uncharacterized protein n=1 Tax=Ascobolus immersus RN42 TaxID=1160509 RepID=A0A3N4HU69_ASCIM|nr:hypothetical protein BJ508DRAFT_417514 [Ascobolus immersus RN42]